MLLMLLRDRCAISMGSTSLLRAQHASCVSPMLMCIAWSGSFDPRRQVLNFTMSSRVNEQWARLALLPMWCAPLISVSCIDEYPGWSTRFSFGRRARVVHWSLQNCSALWAVFRLFDPRDCIIQNMYRVGIEKYVTRDWKIPEVHKSRNWFLSTLCIHCVLLYCTNHNKTRIVTTFFWTDHHNSIVQ